MDIISTSTLPNLNTYDNSLFVTINMPEQNVTRCWLVSSLYLMASFFAISTNMAGLQDIDDDILELAVRYQTPPGWKS